jgi:hypothetical protein
VTYSGITAWRWLREIAWPFASAALDGEAVASDGHEGIQAVFTEPLGETDASPVTAKH